MLANIKPVTQVHARVMFSDKFETRVWSKVRSDGSIALVTTILAVANLEIQGYDIDSESVKDATAEIRLSVEDFKILMDEIKTMSSSSVEILIETSREPVLGVISPNGQNANSMVFWGALKQCEPGTAMLEGAKFSSKEEILAHLQANKSQAKSRRDEYRAARNAASTAAATAGVEATANSVMA